MTGKVIVAAVLVSLAAFVAHAQQQPSFRTGVELVSLNVTVTEPVDSGFVTVYPCGARPLASNLNFVPWQTVPNAVIAPLAADGTVCFYSNVDTHLVADVNGYFDAGASLHTLTPVRLFDTRPAEPYGAVIVDKRRL